MGRRFGLTLAAAALALSTTVLGATGAGAASGDDAAEFCRQFAEAGGLELFGLNMGECVNFEKGPSSDQSNNFVAAFCGLDEVQLALGATDKGQCIQAFRSGG